jgi:maltooligosyltrehalose synthase
LETVNSLTEAMVNISFLEISDLYQGIDSGNFSLIDPDNHRPVISGMQSLVSLLEAAPVLRF